MFSTIINTVTVYAILASLCAYVVYWLDPIPMSISSTLHATNGFPQTISQFKFSDCPFSLLKTKHAVYIKLIFFHFIQQKSCDCILGNDQQWMRVSLYFKLVNPIYQHSSAVHSEIPIQYHHLKIQCVIHWTSDSWYSSTDESHTGWNTGLWLLLIIK